MTNEEAIIYLREAHNNLFQHIPYNDNYHNAIDLAIKALETGEVYMTGEDYNLYIEGYKAGKKDFAPKQGEWDKIGEIGLAYKCNKCGEVSVIPTNFCPNCGADMKGGAENDK